MSRTPLTLFEHDTLPYAWTERDLRLLAALNGRTGDNILTPKIDAKGKQLQAAQFVGVVRLGEQIIQILPKIHRSGERDASAREATANLLHMLAYAADVPIDEQGVAPLLAKKSDWFELLIHLFATHLASLWQRGALHAYRGRSGTGRAQGQVAHCRSAALPRQPAPVPCHQRRVHARY